jgi:hypothetical protein
MEKREIARKGTEDRREWLRWHQNKLWRCLQFSSHDREGIWKCLTFSIHPRERIWKWLRLDGDANRCFRIVFVRKRNMVTTLVWQWSDFFGSNHEKREVAFWPSWRPFKASKISNNKRWKERNSSDLITIRHSVKNLVDQLR